MTRAIARRAWTLLLCLSVASSTIATTVIASRSAHADDDSESMRAAKKHFAKGEKLFALGKFDVALDEYQRAFDAKPIPAFLFNIGQCYRNLGDYQQAIFSFEKYLKLSPDAANRDAVRTLIDDLTAKQDKLDAERAATPVTPPQPLPQLQSQPAQPPPTQPTTAHDDHPFYARWWFWSGVVAIALVGGGVAYEATRDNAPATSLGNITFGK